MRTRKEMKKDAKHVYKKLYLSFGLWKLRGAVTFGLSNVFFLNA